MEEERPLALSSPFEPISNTSATGKHTFRPKTLSNIKQARSITGIVLVLSYIQNLMLHQRTATNRELYYFFVTFFRNQKECDGTIGEICNLLQVERISLGLNASPKGEQFGFVPFV
jgi:DNA topoisomerase VI subunit A